MVHQLMNEATLQAKLNEKVIFQSKGKWINPIFELQDFLNNNSIETSSIEVHDRVIGKAAAMLFLYLGIGYIYGDIMSELADTALCNHGIKHSYSKLVERIDCKTEELLLEIDDVKTAYEILCKRANRC